MKKINFVKTVPERAYREVRFWILGTGLIIGTSFCAIIVLNIAQLPGLFRMINTYSQLKTQVCLASQGLPKNDAIKKEHELLCARIDKIKRRQTDQEKSLLLLQTLHQANAQNIRIDRFHIDTKNFEISAAGAATKDITQFAQKIGKLPAIKTVQVTALSHNNTKQDSLGFTCTIKGQFVSKKQAKIS